MEYREFMNAAAHVVPSARQMNWFGTEIYAFVHFTVNTYTGREWGLGNESESIFNPVNLDCDGWVEAVKSCGAKALILTCKHHDGFCLWPSAYTEHSVKNSPCKYDVVKETAEACRRGGIKFGVYLSPWDRNCSVYGTPAYNDFYCGQLTELLTNYGELFAVWFDGACGEGPTGKKQVYDFDRYFSLVRKYQPNAVIFNDGGPDVRWCGNEAGTSRAAEWAVVPSELCHFAEVQTGAGPESGSIAGAYNTEPFIGGFEQIKYSKGLVFAGSEFDMSIRPGWFYHPEEEPHSLERLMKSYINSVGGNGCLNLNVPPMPDGRFDPRDVQRLKEFGAEIKRAFDNPIPAQESTEWISETQCKITLKLPEKRRISYVILAEDIAQGQRVEIFDIKPAGGNTFRGTTIGHKRICPVDAETDTVEVIIKASRAKPVMLPVVLT